jgi:myo-inositol-1(or 4)-monophosphatase
MEPKLNELEYLARGAGEILRAGFRTELDVQYKGEIDLVTEMDYKTEEFLLNYVREKYPDHSVITEERGELDGNQSHQWLIDPLDGTTNYSHGLPIYAVSIAYARDGRVHLGVVYDPSMDAIYSAERGVGAWVNGDSLKVSNATSLDKSLLTTGFPYYVRTNPDNNLDHYAHFAVRSVAVRRLGSASLDLCYVAAGNFDGYWELTLGAWDIAAGALIVEEAGGVVTRIDGERNYLKPPYSVIAANSTIHAFLLEYFQNNS